EEALAGDAGVVAVAEDRLDDVIAVAAGAKLVGAAQRVRLRVALVVEIVEQAGRAPDLELVASDPEPALAVPADSRLDRGTVLAGGLRRRPVGREGPGVGAGRHGPRVAAIDGTLRRWPGRSARRRSGSRSRSSAR